MNMLRITKLHIINPTKNNYKSPPKILKKKAMDLSYKNLLQSFLVFQLFIHTFLAIHAAPLFREYIGAEGENVTFSQVPINPNIDFHFILSFALDYTDSKHPQPTNGNFRVNWDAKNLNSSQVSLIKKTHPNVKVAMSLAGDTVRTRRFVEFYASTINSWVDNAVSSITRIVKEYDLDGIDIDYEHFNKTDPETFAECIGSLLSNLKEKRIISFASIAPYDNELVQPFYLALWRKYGHLIDYVNFQFYAYEKMKSSSLFLQYYERQRMNYEGGKILVSFGTDKSGGLRPDDGFFDACKILSDQGELHGIFVWSADDSKKDDFRYEKKAQEFLAGLVN